MTEETEEKKQPISVEEDTLTFDGNPKYIEGDIIVSGETDIAPEGFIRKVVSVDVVDGEYVYKTETATLADVFEEAHRDCNLFCVN